MNLDLPTVSVTLGPEWASDLNDALVLIDAHDHTSGKGLSITPSAININAALSFNGQSAEDVGYLNLESQLITSLNPLLVYSVTGDLYWNNGSAVPVQITAGGSVVSAPASLTVMEYATLAVDTSISPATTNVVYGIDTTAPRTITLPNASTVAAGRFFVLKDASGLSETNTLTIAAAGGNTIDGNASVSINSNFGSHMFVSNGVDTFLIF